MKEAAKKITANIPAKLLQRVQRQTKLGITETLVAGLEELEKAHKRAKLRELGGKVSFDLDLELTRQSPAYAAAQEQDAAAQKASGQK